MVQEYIARGAHKVDGKVGKKILKRKIPSEDSPIQEKVKIRREEEAVNSIQERAEEVQGVRE